MRAAELMQNAAFRIVLLLRLGHGQPMAILQSILFQFDVAVNLILKLMSLTIVQIYLLQILNFIFTVSQCFQ